MVEHTVPLAVDDGCEAFEFCGIEQLGLFHVLHQRNV
jgi:hypothetical protein